jgi:molybdopterin converting factor small subunit
MAGNGGLGVLEKEHADIEELFERVSDPDANRRKVLQEILKRISTHIAVERGVFYPVMTDKGFGGPEAAQKLKDDYEEMERLLVLIERRKVNSPDIPQLVTELRDRFIDHNREFAERVKPDCMSDLSPEELQDLDERMASADDVILSHPHPHMLALGPISRLTTRLAASFDRLRDRTVDNRMMPHDRGDERDGNDSRSGRHG